MFGFTATNKTRKDDALDNCFPNLTFEDRVRGFCLFSILGTSLITIGYILQLGGLSKYLAAAAEMNPAKFIFIYSLGNILSMSA